MKKKGIKLFSLLISTMVFICNISFVKAEETSAYAYSDSATSNGVTLKVEWNEPVLGKPTTFHVSATGGSGIYKFNMEAPSYTNPDELAYESVADPSRGEWTKYTSECESQDYTFTMMATGTYNFRFHVMDIKAGVTYLRTNTYIQVSCPDYPSVNSIVQSAVTRCNSDTNGSDYSKALWLHDWLLEQLDYDNSLKWSSAESALTRSSGTCQAYERAYAKLLSAAGIENAETRDTYDGHTWNAMKLDGKWYQVDCTWDDSSENYYNFNRTHLYFALSDELMTIAHQGHNKIYTVEGYATPSNSLEHNYFVQNGDAQQWVESYRNRIQENLNNKNTEFSIQADNSTYPPSIYGIQNGVIAYVMNQNEWFVNGKKVELVAKTNDKQFDFKASYSKVDSEAPVIDVNSIKLSTKSATKDDTVTISVKMTDNVGITSSVVYLINQETKKDIFLRTPVYNESDNTYEFSMKIGDEVPNGHWHISSILAKDAVNNSTLETFDLNEHSFVVSDSKVDSEAPVIDVNSIKLSTNSATKGDTVTISVKMTDNVGITSSVVYLINQETKKDIFLRTPVYNESNDTYEFSMKIGDEVPNGHWRISSILAKDAVNNSTLETFSFKDRHWITVTRDNKDVHQWDEGKIISEPTCTKECSKIFTCLICNMTQTVVIKALGHDYSSSWTIDKKATCTESGSKSHHCTRCVSKSDVTIVSKLSHDWILMSTVNPTKDHDGKKIYTCSLCKETKEELIPKLIGKWVSNSIGKRYEYSDGTYENSGFKKIDNETYYFTNNGYIKNGWLSLNNSWYYFKDSGSMVISHWVGVYYMDADGKMMTNSFTPDGYYCRADGVYVRNAWIKYNGNYYYMNANGLMRKNAWVGNYWCGEDGKYMKSSWVDDGKYYAGSNGVYVTNKWIGDYYLNGAGFVTKNAWVGNYWCGEDGKYMKSCWVDNNRYYVNENGVYVAGAWQQDSKGWKYHAGNVYAKDITLNINGTSYTFDSNGYMK